MKDLNKKALSVIRETRGILLPFWGKIESSEQKGNFPVDAVTRLDKEIEKFVSEKLKELDPTIDFVGEEFGGNREAERFWILDPIDGTGHFIRGLPFCTTMLALIENGQVTFSVIYDFINDIAYHAEKGRGAFKNEQPIKVNDRPISNAYIGWESHLDKEENLALFFKLREKVILFKAVCSGFEYAMIAEGKLEGRACFDPYGKDYDFASGSLLVEEAGGRVANIGKNTYSYKDLNFIAANKKVFESLTSGEDAIFPINQ